MKPSAGHMESSRRQVATTGRHIETGCRQIETTCPHSLRTPGSSLQISKHSLQNPRHAIQPVADSALGRTADRPRKRRPCGGRSEMPGPGFLRRGATPGCARRPEDQGMARGSGVMRPPTGAFLKGFSALHGRRSRPLQPDPWSPPACQGPRYLVARQRLLIDSRSLFGIFVAKL